jgi:hypothetical protein
MAATKSDKPTLGQLVARGELSGSIVPIIRFAGSVRCLRLFPFLFPVSCPPVCPAEDEAQGSDRPATQRAPKTPATRRAIPFLVASSDCWGERSLVSPPREVRRERVQEGSTGA